MEIDIDKTPLSEENYTEFMKVLDAEILRQYPTAFSDDYKHSETLFKDHWLSDYVGNTVQDIIDGEVEVWED